jgi:glycosyltransferase involved in cell wall biosynthesis
LSSGGAERFIVDLSNELSKQNEVTLLTLKDDMMGENSFFKSELSPKVNYYNLGFGKLNITLLIKLIHNIYNFVKAQNPDIVHLHLTRVTLLSLFLAIFYRKPLYVETIHNKADKITQNKLEFVLLKIAYRLKLIRPVTISVENEKSFMHVFKQKPAAMIFNGRNKPLNSNKNDIAKEEINKYKNNDNTLVLTHIARFHPSKNQSLLIAAFNRMVKEEKLNAILLIIGNGFETEEGRKLQDTACCSVHFLGKKLYIADYLDNSDAFILSSLYEGMPISLIEALACGCIPLSTPVSGSIDIIEDGINGFLSTDFTEDAFVDMLKRFAKNYKTIDNEILIKLCKNKLSIEKCAECYQQLYNSL